MKILEIHKFHKMGGGADKAFLDNINLFKEKGHEVIVFSMKRPDNIPCKYENYFIENRDYHSSNFFHKIVASFKSIYSQEARIKLDRLIKDYKPDIAHIHNYMYQLTPSILYALKDNNIPIVNTLHDYYPMCAGYRFYNERNKKICEDCKGGKYFNIIKNRCMKSSAVVSLFGMINSYYWQYKKVLNLINIFISPSDFLRNKMIEYGYPQNKICTINNFINTGEEPQYKSEDYILYAGLFLMEKGVHNIIKAFKDVKSNLKLYLAGSGPYEENLRELAKGNEDKIKFLGFLSQKDLRKFLDKAKCVIVPSIWYENFPYSVLEACLHGKVVIASKIGGIPEIIEHKETGLLYEPENIEQLTQHINYLYQNPQQVISMGKKAREKVVKICYKESYYNNIISIFQKLNKNEQ